MNQKQVGIVVFDNIEVLDFCGPFETLEDWKSLLEQVGLHDVTATDG